jgi:hypothetical protein
MENQPPVQNSFVPGPQVPLPNATAVLVLGIISIVGCFCYGTVGLICGIICLVLANKDLKVYNNSPESYTVGSLSNLKTGRICAIIGLSLSILFLLFVIVMIITVGIAGLSDPQHFLQQMNR